MTQTFRSEKRTPRRLLQPLLKLHKRLDAYTSWEIAANAEKTVLALVVLFGLAASLAPLAYGQNYKEQIVYGFTGGADGLFVLNTEHGLYSTTETGGDLNCFAPFGCGTVFQVSETGIESVLHSFSGSPGDGAFPTAAITIDSSGNIYGTTSEGGAAACPTGNGYGCGTVFYLNSVAAETVLHNFAGQPDGQNPQGFVQDAQGNLYGVTSVGGTGGCESSGVNVGCGTVFEVSNAGTYTVLYSFRGPPDGKSPYTLVQDAQGTLYGTTAEGGRGTCYGQGCGVIFKLDTAGRESVVYRFTGGRDGGEPVSVTVGPGGTLYGTTYLGGDLSCGEALGCGVVFQIAKSGVETALYTFMGGSDGSQPENVAIFDGAGTLYGTTFGGGTYGYGTVFRLNKTGGKSLIYAFKGAPDAADPDSGLVRGSNGYLYGTTILGGPSNAGTVYELIP